MVCERSSWKAFPTLYALYANIFLVCFFFVKYFMSGEGGKDVISIVNRYLVLLLLFGKQFIFFNDFFSRSSL